MEVSAVEMRPDDRVELRARRDLNSIVIRLSRATAASKAEELRAEGWEVEIVGGLEVAETTGEHLPASTGRLDAEDDATTIAGMSVDAETLQSRLEDAVAQGRPRKEAAGEVQWSVDLFHAAGVTTEDERDESFRVIAQWLGNNELLVDIAEAYSSFLKEHVEVGDVIPPPRERIDAAWHEWRRLNGRD